MKTNVSIKAVNLKKTFKEITAVDSISFEVKDHNLVSLLGLNGAGKTTTVKMLTGLIKPTSGEAYIYGYSLKDELDEIKKIVAISPQETALANKLTTEENLDFIASLYGIEKEERKTKIDEMIKLFHLEKYRKVRTEKLSGGYKRRLSIAMAIISSPKLLFLDEPSIGLDVINRRELWKIIAALKDRMSIVLTTHYMEEAEELSDYIFMMKEGKIISEGTTSEINEKSDSKSLEESFIKICGGSSNENL